MKNKPNWSKIDRAIINLAGEWIGLGDVITASPLISAIRAASPKCNVYLILTGTRWNEIVELMEGNPKPINVKNGFYRFRNFLIYGLWLRKPWLRTAYFYDYMAPRCRASLLGYLIGARFRFGYSQRSSVKEDIPLHNTHTLPYNSIGISEFDYSKEFNQVTNLKCNSKPYLRKEKILERGGILIKSLGISSKEKLFAMHIGSSFNIQVKRWPVESFVNLARIIKDNYNISSLIILGPDENDLAINLPKKSFVHVLNNRFSIYDIAAILTHCECLISNDSGIMNLGFSLGVPGIGLFGPTNSMKHEGWYPKGILIQSRYNLSCSPCYGAERFMECAKVPPPCMEAITVDEVLEQIEKLLQKCAA